MCSIREACYQYRRVCVVLGRHVISIGECVQYYVCSISETLC